MSYQPPFQLTHTMMRHVARIGELIGTWKAANRNRLVPELRRGNRIKTIQASLAVEQNTLTLEQVTAVIEGKMVLGLPKEIQEVRNAFAAYEAMEQWHPHQIDDLLAAHALLLHGLIDDAGHWRSKGAGIYRGDQLVHMAPPASQIPRLMTDLFDWLAHTDAHPLIASAAFHYEFEFIHPFGDGNGRIGRLWQTLILSHWQPMLAFLPVETVIKHRQQTYYQLLTESDQKSDCSAFIEFLLQAIEDSLQEAINAQLATDKMRVKMRVEMRVKTPDLILKQLSENPDMTLAKVAQQIGKSVTTVERSVAKLKQQGRLAFIGPKKGGHWQVIKE
ncbi:Fic family protein [Tolumonas osonensis]|uniref:Fic family protein n=1 Tax=Tolumonas osonensis TaxID=675874 RepID=A0A841GKS8_9GAMM|nr:Fic family protein [Tolumonas osonensis]MBB6055925.1 Fic family protein [Tolumonas osonensis]